MHRSCVFLLVASVVGGCARRPAASGKAEDIRARDSTIAWNAPYADPSPHTIGFVSVGEGVRLQYLDWGGVGPAIVFLTGFGLSAHIYDDLAPQFTDRFHVIALTRRGHGESDHPDSGYGIATALEDIRQLLDALHIHQAILVGHSHGGWEAARFAARYPDRTLAVIFLDGTITPVGYQAMAEHEPLQRPPPNLSSPDSARAWYTRYFFGTWSTALEADMHHHTVDGTKWDESDHDFETHPAQYQDIAAPALAIYEVATIQSRYFWLAPTDTVRSGEAEVYLRQWFNPWQQRGVDEFVRHIRHGRAVRLPGNHYLFVTHQNAVVAAMREFLLSASVQRRASAPAD